MLTQAGGGLSLEEGRWAADAKAAGAVQGQVGELARMVKDLQRQRVSTDREIKFHRYGLELSLTPSLGRDNTYDVDMSVTSFVHFRPRQMCRHVTACEPTVFSASP